MTASRFANATVVPGRAIRSVSGSSPAATRSISARETAGVECRVVFEGVVEDAQRPHAANYAATSGAQSSAESARSLPVIFAPRRQKSAAAIRSSTDWASSG